MRSSGRALLWVLLGVSAFVIAACAFGGWAIWQAVMGGAQEAARQLPNERASAKREGIPLTPEELFSNRPVDPKKNAGPILAKEAEAVHKVVSTQTQSRVFTPIAKGIAGPEVLAEARALLAKAKPHLGAILAAAKLPECDFGKDYRLGANVLFPEFARLKAVVKVLAARANMEARAGDYAGAQRDLAASFRLAEFSGREPNLIGLLVQIACNAITHAALREILSEHPNDARAIAIGEHTARLSAHADFGRAFRGEVVMGRMTIKTLKNMKEFEMLTGGGEGSGSGPESGSIPGFHSDGFVDRMRGAWEARHLQFWRRVFARMPKDPQDYMALNTVMNDETAKEDRQKDLSYVMNRIMLPVFGQAVLAGCRDLANQRLSEAYWRLLAYKKRHGDFPQSLDKLGVKLIDPFDGQPLRYRKRAVGFQLYSIDRDLSDDGGATPPKGAPANAPKDFVAEFS